jgi:hypothetical protein
MNWKKHKVTGKIAHIVQDVNSEFQSDLKTRRYSEETINKCLEELKLDDPVAFEYIKFKWLNFSDSLYLAVTWNNKEDGPYNISSLKVLTEEDLVNWEPIDMPETDKFLNNLKRIRHPITDGIVLAIIDDDASILEKNLSKLDKNQMEKVAKWIARYDKLSCFRFLYTKNPDYFKEILIEKESKIGIYQHRIDIINNL